METQVSDKSISENIESLFERTSDYIETRIDLYKLKAVDKSTDVLSTVISKMLVILVFIMFIFIINIGIALLIGEWLGKAYYGFFVLAAVYLIAGFIIRSNRRKWFKEPLADQLIRKFLK